MRELEQLIGELAGTPLDRSRPLWEIHVCEGLADGRIAVVTKMHHAVADGAAANALLANIMDLVPDAVPSLPAEPWQGEPTPRRRELLRDAVIAWFRQLAWLPALLLKTVRSVRAVIAHKRQSTVPTPRPLLDTPRTSFNGHITARRSFATASLSLEDFKKVKTAHAVTLNDVVLAVVSGAMRTWMAGHGEHPKASLVAGVPVSTDTGGVVRLVGNRVSNLFTSLHTDVDDPVERLLAIARTTAEAKVVQRTLGLDMLESWVQYTPPAPFTAFMRAYSALRAANLHAAPFNLVVSNVPGPPVPVHIAGARLDALFSVGPILQGIGLNITVWSYLERMNFSALACPDTLPDVHVLMAGLEPALAELLTLS